MERIFFCIYVQTQCLLPETSRNGFICLGQFSVAANKHRLRLKTTASTRPKHSHAVKLLSVFFLLFLCSCSSSRFHLLQTSHHAATELFMLSAPFKPLVRRRVWVSPRQIVCKQLFFLWDSAEADTISSRRLSSVCCCRLATDFLCCNESKFYRRAAAAPCSRWSLIKGDKLIQAAVNCVAIISNVTDHLRLDHLQGKHLVALHCLWGEQGTNNSNYTYVYEYMHRKI